MSEVSIPIGLLAVSGVISAGSAFGQIDSANKAREYELEQIRNQQVQLRLQENQASIERYKNLRKILATEQVMFGARNISPQSGTVRAIINQNFKDFEEDETADRLNYLGKQIRLDQEATFVKDKRNIHVQQAILGFGKDTVGLGMSYFNMPAQSLVDRSVPKDNPFNINRSL